MAIISVELWSTSVEKVGPVWIVQSNSTLTTLLIDDVNNDGVIDNAEWDAFTPGGGGGLDRGSTSAVYDGLTGTTGVLYSPVIYSIGDDVSDVITSLSNTFEAELGDVVCFCCGTKIRTDHGEVPIEQLEVGDMVQTVDNGFEPIRWIGSKTVSGIGRHAPISFQKGTLGNKRELRLSPQHRVLLRDWRAELMFGYSEVLVPAKSLVNEVTIRRIVGGSVEYFHLLLDSHNLVFAEDAPAESLFLSNQSLSALSAPDSEEICALFPEILENDFVHQVDAARPVLKEFEAQAMPAA